MVNKDPLAVGNWLNEARKTVVVADRNEVLLMYLRIVLERMGFRVVPVRSRKDLHDLLHACAPDLLLLGAISDRFDHGELIRDLGKEHGHGSLPFAVIQNSHDDPLPLRGEDPAFLGYVGRPVNLFRLYDALFEAIRFPSGKRCSMRVPFREKVTVIQDGTERELWAVSLSEGGLFVRSRNEVAVGAQVVVSIPMGVSRRIILDAKVIYAKEAMNEVIGFSEPGFALQFEGITPEQALQLKVCILGLLVGDLLDEQEQPVLSVVSHANELYQDLVVEHVRLEKEFAGLHRYVTSLLDALPLGVLSCRTGPQGKATIRSYNPAAENILRTELGSCVGQPLEAVFPALAQSALPSEVERICRVGGAYEAREYFCRKVQGFLDILVFQPAPGHATLVLRDVSGKKMFEDKLQRLQRLESVGVLAGGIAHDFNNFLQSISANIFLAQALAGDPAAMEDLLAALGHAEVATNSAARLTRQLVTFSRGGTPVLEPLNLCSIVEEAVTLGLRGSNITVDFSFPEGLPIVKGDRGQLEQVFANLAINAQQAMPRGGKLSVSCRREIVDEEHPALGRGEHLVISVRDTGTGIPEETLPKIFDPFFSTKERGNGLGLATVHSIVRSHKGWIDVSSVEGVGSTFELYFPKSVEQVLPSKDQENPLVWRSSGRILLMDDEAPVRAALGAMLEYFGVEVTAVPHGEAALEAYRNALGSGSGFDAVFLDLTIKGGMGGTETIETLLAIDPRVKAIAVSGYSESPVLATHREFGFIGALQKPVTLVVLGRMLKACLGS